MSPYVGPPLNEGPFYDEKPRPKSAEPREAVVSALRAAQAVVDTDPAGVLKLLDAEGTEPERRATLLRLLAAALSIGYERGTALATLAAAPLPSEPTSLACSVCGAVVTHEHGGLKHSAAPLPSEREAVVAALRAFWNGDEPRRVIVELPPIGPDGRCTACGKVPSRDTGSCGCHRRVIEHVLALAATPLPSDTPADGLDAAWREAEAALPMAGWLDPLDGRWVIPTGTWSIDIRHAESGDGYFEPAVEGYWATAKIESSSRPFAMRGDLGTTPAEALLALAATLDHREQPYGTQEYPKADTMHEELES